MADLPKERFAVDMSPFFCTGTYYFGPLFVKQGRSVVKRQECIFTCLTTRASPSGEFALYDVRFFS